MKFDLKNVPFSRYGSYLAFSHLAATPEHDEGLFLRTVHGGTAHRELFRVELTDGDVAIPFIEEASPTVLRLVAAKGHVEICFPEPKLIRVRGEGVGIRLSKYPEWHGKNWIFELIYQTDSNRWVFNTRIGLTQYMLTALKGCLSIDAPWQGHYCHYIQVDFQPDTDGVWECAVEEFTSSWHQRSYNESFEVSQQHVKEDYQAWQNQQVELPHDLAEARKMATYVNWSCVVAPEGLLTRPTMFMSKNWMDNVWSWDHCFNALALVYKNPALAWDQFMLFVDAQDDRGAFPDYFSDSGIVWNFCKPPIHGWTLRRLMGRTSFITKEHLTEVYDPLCRWTEWWFKYRDDDDDGLPQYNHGNDSGWDNSTVFAAGVPVESPDLAAFLVYQMDVLAQVAHLLDWESEAKSWADRADTLLKKMLATFWRGDHFVALRARSHEEIESESLLLFLPILLGKRLPDDILHHLVAGLKQEGRFLTQHGLATESVDSSFYQADGYWRGPIWAPSTMLIVDGLNSAGETVFARELSRQFCAMVSRSGMAENFDAISGVGLRDRAYSWTSSVFLVLGHEYLKWDTT